MAGDYTYMQKDQLDKILQELYQLDATLREHEEDLVELISRMSDIRPDTRFDAAFAARLKKELLQQVKNAPTPFFAWFRNRTYFTVGALTLALVVIILAWPQSLGHILSFSNDGPSLLINHSDSSMTRITGKSLVNNSEFLQLSDRAFGNLTINDSAGTADELATSANTGPAALAGGAIAPVIAPESAALSNDGFVDGTMLKADARMIPLGFNVKYVYKGEALEMKDKQGEVYRRVKGDGKLSQELTQLIGGVDYGNLDIKSFKNLQMSSLSLLEDSDFGLAINFDFAENSINIGENWNKWQMTSDSARLKMNDVPVDQDLIAIADRFISEHKINTAHYNTGIVDNSWRENYLASTDKENFYIPEYATVVYPLLINGQTIHEQNGDYAGLRVTISLVNKKVSGLSGLNTYRYESSIYVLSQSAPDIIAAAEKGGLNRINFGARGGSNTAELGAPTRAYVQLWRSTGSRNEELFVPALIFPVTRISDNNFYSGSKYVIVPLVQEMLDDILQDKGSVSGGEIMPLIR